MNAVARGGPGRVCCDGRRVASREGAGLGNFKQTLKVGGRANVATSGSRQPKAGGGTRERAGGLTGGTAVATRGLPVHDRWFELFVPPTNARWNMDDRRRMSSVSVVSVTHVLYPGPPWRQALGEVTEYFSSCALS